MAKTSSQRRSAKRSAALAQLARSSPERTKRVLETMLRGWVNEARYRATAFRYETAVDTPLKAFAMIDLAQRTLLEIGPHTGNIAQGVLQTLRHECEKAVAQASDPRLCIPAADCTAKLRLRNVRNRQRD